MVFGTSIGGDKMSNEPKKQKMKVKNSIRKWTEPLTYVVLVAAFGFITTVVTHARSESPVQEKDMVSLTLENELEAMLNAVKDSKEVSL
jgi:hypothetical protein